MNLPEIVEEKLKEQGAVVNNGELSLPVINSFDVVSVLTDYVVLHVSGDDAEAFLESQLSNDVKSLANTGSQITSWSTAKGRVLVVFRLIKIVDGYLITMPLDLVEPMVKRLRMFVLRSKVTIDRRDDLMCIGLSGQAINTLQEKEIIDAMPGALNQVHNIGETRWLVQVDESGRRCEVIGDADIANNIIEATGDNLPLTDHRQWRLQNIDAGIPSITAATSEAHVLQMLNLQRIEGVSFKKGCFPGQEVVARMHYKAKLKRQMYRLETTAEAALQPGDSIYQDGASSAVGEVVDAVASDDMQRLLAVLKISAADKPLFADQENQYPLALLEMPYSLEVDD